jgi:hypothetical protein
MRNVVVVVQELTVSLSTRPAPHRQHLRQDRRARPSRGGRLRYQARAGPFARHLTPSILRVRSSWAVAELHANSGNLLGCTLILNRL